MNLSPHLRVPVVAGVSLLVLTTSACGGGSKGSKEAPKTPSGQPSTTSGYDQTAAQIVEQSEAALRAAKSVHVKGPLPAGAYEAPGEFKAPEGAIDLSGRG